MSLPQDSYSLRGQDTTCDGTDLLSAILHSINAPEFLQKFVDDDHQDDSIPLLSRWKPEKITSKYGLPHETAAAFIDRCRAPPVIARSRPVPSHIDDQACSTDSPQVSACDAALHARFVPSSAETDAASSPIDDSVLLRELNLEMSSKLGKGGFGTVYACRDLVHRRVVAVKVVSDPKHAQEAVREGQKLLRANHKNIVQLYRVHDLHPAPGVSACALEMEVVKGGDLYQHLHAARHRPDARLPRAAVLRFSRQLLEAVHYLHHDMKLIHGDIKPQNVLLQCHPVPADGSAVDYSDAEIKLADFGLSKVMDQDQSQASFLLTNISSKAGVVKGTMWYVSPWALQGASGVYQRSYSDDIWSACLVIVEMDTGLTLQQLMTSPGSVKQEELLTKTSQELLPLLASVLLAQHHDLASSCNSAADLLHKLDSSLNPLFIWQYFDVPQQQYSDVHPAASFFLEEAFSANQPLCTLPLQSPLDLHFDIKPLLSSTTALGSQIERSTGRACVLRRLMKPSVISKGSQIPIWQELVEEKDWLQCSPALCARLEIEFRNPNAAVDAKKFRRIVIEPTTIGSPQLPHSIACQPHLEIAHADDIALLTNRVHESLPEWDITKLEQVVNNSLASRYAAYRHRVTVCCNGNPNESMLFHFAHPDAISKIWQDGEGHDPRLSTRAEVGKGSYFSKHALYGYAHNYSLWPSPPDFAVKPEPPIGETMVLFASLVCLGNVANVGPGCETCSSPAWEAWKSEPPKLLKPTRPPTMVLSADPAQRQHILDIMQVKNEPRYDSVMSTEGDFGTHPASTSRDSSGKKLRDIMHPRLKANPTEMSKQYVLFDNFSSYPMYIITLTKKRNSPVTAQHLLDAGYRASRIKSLGFSLLQLKEAGCSAWELREEGFEIEELIAAKFELSELIAGGYSVSALLRSGVTSSQLKDSGCSVQQLKQGGITLQELLSAFANIAELIEGGVTVAELKSAGISALRLKVAGCSAKQLLSASFSKSDLQDAGYGIPELHSIVLTESSDPEELNRAKAYYSDVQFARILCCQFAAAEWNNPKVSKPLCNARDTLGLIVAYNTHLSSRARTTVGAVVPYDTLITSAPSSRQPTWPRHEALLRFDLPVHRLTTQKLSFPKTKKWVPRFLSLRGHFLYMSGSKSIPDTIEGTLAFYKSNPAPDGHYCMDLHGSHALPPARFIIFHFFCNYLAQAA